MITRRKFLRSAATGLFVPAVLRAGPVGLPFFVRSGSNGLRTSLTAYYMMDDASGNIVDATGNGWTGTKFGNPTYSQSGIINTAINFGLAGDAFDVSNTLMSANPTSQSFSIQCWLNGGSGNNSAFIGQCLPNVYWDGYFLTTGSQIGFQVHNDSDTNFQVNSAQTWINNSWNHVCMGFDSANSLIWIQMNNETRVTTGGVTTVKRTNDQAVTIGNYSTHVLQFPGKMDEIGIWTNRVLTSADVSLLYNGGAGLPFSSIT